MSQPLAARVGRIRTPRILAVAAFIAAIIGTLLPSSPASAFPLSGANKMLGVRNIQYGSSPSAAPYLGSYGFLGPDGVLRRGFCVEHAGAAPTPNSTSAYSQQANAVTGDSIMVALVNQSALLDVYAFDAVVQGNTFLQQIAAVDGAAIAAGAHYRAAAMSLPGETAYPAGSPPPLVASAFNISDSGGSTGVLNNTNIGAVSASAVEQRAFDYYVTASQLPIPWSAEATNQHVDNTFNADGTAVARIRPVAANGQAARGFLNGAPSLTNGSGLQWFSDAALTTPITVPTAIGFSGSPTEVWARWTVTDPSQPTGLTTSVMTIADSITYWEPNTASEQNLVVAGGTKDVPVVSIQVPPTTPPTLTVTKTSTGGLPVGGIQFAVTNAGGLDLGTITVNADGTSNILPIHLDWLGTDVTLTEVASTAWSTGHTPAAPVTVTIAEGLNTVQVANTPATTEISVTKQDADRADQHSLAGAHVAVRKDTDANGSFETLVDEGDTLENGFLVIDGLTVGSYQVEEVTPPAGYTFGAVRTITFVVQAGPGGLEIIGLDGFDDMDGDGNPDDVQFKNQKPGITTQVVQDGSPAGAGPISVPGGTLVRDQATLTGVAAGTAGTIVTQAYGPFATRDEITAASCTAAKAGPSVTDTVTGPGPHVSSTLNLATGHWVLVETWTDNTPGSTATATHVCNDTNEMIEVTEDTPDVEISTTAGSATIPLSGSQSDIAHVTGTDGADWEIVLKVYGPFKTVDEVTGTVCVDANMVFTVTYTGTGDGDFESPAFHLPSAGFYTMVESITTGDGRTATHTCGDTDETFSVTPEVSTTAREGDLVVGSPQADVLTLAGVPDGEEATVTLTVYGPFDSLDQVDSTVCTEDNIVWEDEFTVIGSGVHTSPDFVLDFPGVFTMVETVTYGGVTASHACGDTHETFNVREPEETTTTTSTTVPDSTTTTVPGTTTTTIKSSGGGGNGGGGGLAYTGSSILYTVALALFALAAGMTALRARRRRS